MKDKAAFIYIDDTQIIGQIVQRVCGQAVKVLASARREYSGIFDGTFSDRSDFRLNLTAVAHELAQTLAPVPATIAICVPNAFCQAQTVQTEINFAKPTKVTPKHVQALWADTLFDDAGREIFSRRALFFKVAEYDEVMLDVTGMVTTNVQMVASALSVSNEFRPLIDAEALRRFGFMQVDLVSLAECELFTIPEKYRDAGCSLVRSDFFTTSIVNIIGDGITQISHFDVGAGHIIKEVAEGFSLPYETAQEFLLQATPTFNANLGDTYVVQGHSIPAPMFNEFILRRLQDYAARLVGVELAKVVYLAGGNLTQIYGVKNLLANACDRRLHFCRDALTNQIKYPENSLLAVARFLLK